MRIELLEKLVFALAVLAIIMVAALVGVFSFVIQQSSGISKEEEVATIQVDEWLADARSIAGGGTAIVRNQPIFIGVERPGTPGAGTPGSITPTWTTVRMASSSRWIIPRTHSTSTTSAAARAGARQSWWRLCAT